MRPRRPRGIGLGVVALAFVAGALVDGYLRVYGPPLPRIAKTVDADDRPLLITSAPPAPPETASPPTLPAVVATTGRRNHLQLPIDGVEPESLKGGFAEARTGHPHEAVDILAPRNTPVHAVEDGSVAKLFVSRLGGNTIYEFDPAGQYAYYYAHLERYATGIREGDPIKKGQVIGYVGTSGNAPPNTPHLHFAVFELGPERRWWKGKAIDPYVLFR